MSVVRLDPDYDNPLTVLYVPFNGAAIVPTNNSNWSQLNDPAFNERDERAELITDPTQPPSVGEGRRPAGQLSRPVCLQEIVLTTSRTSGPRTSAGSAICGTWVLGLPRSPPLDSP